MSGWPHAVQLIRAEGLHFHGLRHTGDIFAVAGGGDQGPDGARGRGHGRTLEDLPGVSADTIGAGDGNRNRMTSLEDRSRIRRVTCADIGAGSHWISPVGDRG